MDDDLIEGQPFRFAAELMNAPWALMPEALTIVASPVAAPLRRATRAAGARSGAIAVLPLSGVLTPNGWQDGGDTSTNDFGAALAEALNDETIGAVLIDINSPGGSVYGCQELADMVFAARKVKPVIGLANSLAASAAYWIGSQCSELYCSPSGEVGSIGVYTQHADISALYARMGINITTISAGKYKTEGSPTAPLTDEAKAAIQESIDGYYASFTASVARGRATAVADVRSGMGQGRCLSAKAAVSAGMLDGVATRAEVLTGMVKKMRAAQAATAETVVDEPVAVVIDPSIAARAAARRRENDFIV